MDIGDLNSEACEVMWHSKRFSYNVLACNEPI